MKQSSFASIIFASVLLLTSYLSLPVWSVSAQERPIFKAESELVVLHVSVRDGGGRYITGLERDAFTVIDDGKPQTLEMFSGDEVPASVGFLIDNSNSMHPNRERVIASAVEFAEHSHPKDEVFVMTFNERVRPAFGPAVIGDMDPAEFAAAMSRAITARGMTAIYDGILEGLRRVGRGVHTRQVLIVVSDGDDNASRATLDDVTRQVHQSDATIYTVALIDPLTREGDPGLLRRLAQATGGESYRPRRVEDIGGAFERIAKDIRSTYTLAYTPTPASKFSDEKARRRTVRVYVRPKDGRQLRVRTRDGYFEKTRGGTG
jgi:Ca-activated chloride channel family protein